MTVQKALKKQPPGYVQTTAAHWLLLTLLLLLASRQASSSAGVAVQHAHTLLPLMVLLLTCSDLAEEDHSAPPEPPSTVLLVNVQLLKWHVAVVHATAPPTPVPCSSTTPGFSYISVRSTRGCSTCSQNLCVMQADRRFWRQCDKTQRRVLVDPPCLCQTLCPAHPAGDSWSRHGWPRPCRWQSC